MRIVQFHNLFLKQMRVHLQFLGYPFPLGQQNTVCQCPLYWIFKSEPRHEKTCSTPYANKGADQPVHPRSLISAFVVRCLHILIPTFAKYKFLRLLLVSVAEQAGLCLTWSQPLPSAPRKTDSLMTWFNSLLVRSWLLMLSSSFLFLSLALAGLVLLMHLHWVYIFAVFWNFHLCILIFSLLPNDSYLITKINLHIWAASLQNQENDCAPSEDSESSLCTQWVVKDPKFLHADSEDSDQTGRTSFCWFCHKAAHKHFLVCYDLL